MHGPRAERVKWGYSIAIVKSHGDSQWQRRKSRVHNSWSWIHVYLRHRYRQLFYNMYKRKETTHSTEVWLKQCLQIPEQGRRSRTGHTGHGRTTFSHTKLLLQLPNTTRWNNDVLMLGQRRRRWGNINTSLFQRVVFAGHAHHSQQTRDNYPMLVIQHQASVSCPLGYTGWLSVYIGLCWAWVLI